MLCMLTNQYELKLEARELAELKRVVRKALSDLDSVPAYKYERWNQNHRFRQKMLRKLQLKIYLSQNMLGEMMSDEELYSRPYTK